MMPRTIYFLMQDRYLYVSLAVFAVVFSQVIEALSYRLKFIPDPTGQTPVRIFRAGVILGASVCFCLGGLSYLRSKTFRSSEALFRDAAHKQPQSFFANFFLAKEILVQAGRKQNELPPELFRKMLSEALTHVNAYREAVDRERKPSAAEEHLVTGEIYFWMGMEEQAAEELTQAVATEDVSQRRDQAYAHWLLAEMSKRQYFNSRAETFREEFYSHLRWILERFPEDGYALMCLGDFQERTGMKREARKAFERAAKIPAYTKKASEALKRMDTEPAPLQLTP
jgi:tetratricopeptide (TPR) repeat protein